MVQSGNTVNGSLTMEFFRMLQETTGYLIQSNEYLIYDCLPVSAQNAFAEFDFGSFFDGGEAEENEIEIEEDEDYIKWVRSLSLRFVISVHCYCVLRYLKLNMILFQKHLIADGGVNAKPIIC